MLAPGPEKCDETGRFALAGLERFLSIRWVGAMAALDTPKRIVARSIALDGVPGIQQGNIPVGAEPLGVTLRHVDLLQCVFVTCC